MCGEATLKCFFHSLKLQLTEDESERLVTALTPETWCDRWELIFDDGPAGLCREASLALQACFPALSLRFGTSIDRLGTSHFHYWCENKEHTIYDPTVGQFACPVDYYPLSRGEAGESKIERPRRDMG